MYVKMLDGHNAGQTVDLRSDVALEFIRQRRAEQAFHDPSPEVPTIVAAKPVEAVKPAKPHGKKAAR